MFGMQRLVCCRVGDGVGGLRAVGGAIKSIACRFRILSISGLPKISRLSGKPTWNVIKLGGPHSGRIVAVICP